MFTPFVVFPCIPRESERGTERRVVERTGASERERGTERKREREAKRESGTAIEREAERGDACASNNDVFRCSAPYTAWRSMPVLTPAQGRSGRAPWGGQRGVEVGEGRQRASTERKK